MTKERRHKLYKKALELLPTKGIHKFTGSYSLCWALVYGLDKEYCRIPSELPILEEFNLFNPNKPLEAFWLTKRDLQTRQIILDFCILMTEN